MVPNVVRTSPKNVKYRDLDSIVRGKRMGIGPTTVGLSSLPHINRGKIIGMGRD